MRKQHEIEVQVEEQVGSVDVVAVRTAALATLVQQAVAAPCEIVIVISDDVALQDLNHRFRGILAPTDVLSFTNDTRGPYAAAAAVGAGTFPQYLGDIVISIDRAREQAAAAGGTLVQELQLLTVHGVLHLLGHDHTTLADKERMWAAQAYILKALGADIPLPE